MRRVYAARLHPAQRGSATRAGAANRYQGLAHLGTTFVPYFAQTVSTSNPTDVFASSVGP